jgi:hypothetical protein
MINNKQKVQLIIGIAIILAILGALYPQLDGLSDFYITWLPSLLGGIITTGVIATFVHRMIGAPKIILFGVSIPVVFFLTLLIKLVVF